MSDRRTFLSGLASLPLVGVTPAAAFMPGLGDLWPKYQLAKGAETQASARLTAANELRPWWAKPGPSLVDRHGAFSGAVTHWPALETYTLPEHDGAWRLIRIGPRDIESQHETRRWFASEARAQELRDRDQAAFKARIARRDAVEEALGIPAFDRAHDDALEPWSDIADGIESLPDGPIDVTAAKILIGLYREAGTSDTADSSVAVGFAVIALRGLLPHLDGALAIDVADPDRPVRDMRLSRGLLPSGEVAEAFPAGAI